LQQSKQTKAHFFGFALHSREEEIGTANPGHCILWLVVRCQGKDFSSPGAPA
jgi:hypothetical protein